MVLASVMAKWPEGQSPGEGCRFNHLTRPNMNKVWSLCPPAPHPPQKLSGRTKRGLVRTKDAPMALTTQEI